MDSYLAGDDVLRTCGAVGTGSISGMQGEAGDGLFALPCLPGQVALRQEFKPADKSKLEFIQQIFIACLTL